MRSVRPLAWLLAAVATVAVAAPARASAATDRVGPGGALVVGLGADGRAVDVTRSPAGSLAVRQAPAGGRFGEGHRIASTPDAEPTAVSVARRFALVTWQQDGGGGPSLPAGPGGGGLDSCCSVLHATVARRDGHVFAARRLSAPGQNVRNVASTVAGDVAAVAWSDSVGVRVAVARGPHRLAAPFTVAQSDGVNVLSVAIVRGVPHVLGVDAIHGDGGPYVELWRRPGRPLHIRTLSSGRARGADLVPQAVAATAAGHLAVLATTVDTTVENRETALLSRRPGTRMRSWPLAGASAPTAPSLAVAGDGLGLLAYARGSGLRVRALRRDGRPGLARRVATLGPQVKVEETALALDARGHGVLAASVLDPARRVTTVLAWEVSSRGGIGPRRVLASATSTRSLAAAAGGSRTRVSWSGERGAFTVTGP